MRFLLLGPVQAWAGDHAVPLMRPRQRAVLACLLLARGRMVSLEGIERALWGGAPPSTARAQIQADVSALRRAFRDSAGAAPIATRPGGYEFDFHDVVVDADEFTEQVAVASEAVAAGRWREAATTLRVALSLWRGPALAGVEAAFVEPARVRLDEQRLTAIERLAEVDLRLGRHQTIVAELTEHVYAHPYRERLRGLFMVALYRSGRRIDALASARELRSRLADQQGLDPGRTIARLETMIIRDDPALHTMFTSGEPATFTSGEPATGSAAPRPPAEVATAGTDAVLVRPDQLPPAIVDFTGHAAHYDRVRELIRIGLEADRPAGSGVLVAITGMGGVGKTALTVKVGHDVRAQFPDGCLFRDLRGAMPQPADAHAVLGTFLRAIGVPGSAVAADPDERLGQYRSMTAQRRLLVVLDDAATEAQVRPLVPTGPGSAVLVTSRRPLAGLDGATGVRLTSLDEADSVDLLRAIVGPDRVASDPAAAARIAALCGGLPLALRIAGARIVASDDLTLERLETLLADEQRRLKELTAGDRDVQACFRVGYQRLSASQSKLFRLIGLHPVSRFSARDAAALAGRPAAAVTPDLRELADAQFVDVVATSTDHRIWMHDLVRRYARDLSESSDPQVDRESAVRRLVESYIDTAHAAGVLLTAGRYDGRAHTPPAVPEPLRFGDASEAVEWYEDAHDGLLAALDQVAALGWHAETWQLAFVLRTFLRIRHHTDDWLAVNDIGLAAARRLGDPTAEVRTLESMCGGYLQARRYADCVETATRMAGLAEVLDDRGAVGRGHHLMGIAYDRLMQRDRAEQHLGTALSEPAYASSPDAVLGYISIGAIYGAQGRYDECRSALLDALRLAREINDEIALCVAHHNLAELCLLTGDGDAGAYHAREEIAIAGRIRFPMREARGNEILAGCLAETDQAAAGQALRRAIEIYDRIDPKVAESSRQRLAQAGHAATAASYA